jgi:hypothetical protein
MNQEGSTTESPISKSFICPYKGCGKDFAESSKLKVHIRIHVIHLNNLRLVKDLMSVVILTAIKLSLPEDT